MNVCDGNPCVNATLTKQQVIEVVHKPNGMAMITNPFVSRISHCMGRAGITPHNSGNMRDSTMKTAQLKNYVKFNVCARGSLNLSQAEKRTRAGAAKR